MVFILNILVTLHLFSMYEMYSFKDNCLDIPLTLCGNNGDSMMTTINKNKNLIGWWTFDDKHGYDHSGNGLIGDPVPDVGPPSFVKGYSAAFDGKQMMKIDNHANFVETSSLTIMFWIYLLEDSTGAWRTLVHKGNGIQELSPTIMFWPKERRLHVRVSTEYFWNEGLESKGAINLKQWVHVSVIASGETLKLYINGNVDNQIFLKGKVRMNNGPMHIGKDPWHQGVKCYLDELKIYNVAVRDKELEAMVGSTNPLVGPTYTKLGCESCNYIDAMKACPDSYHLCSFSELYSGGYMSARKNGWFKYNTEVWARENQVDLEKQAKTNEVGNKILTKMAICCSDL